MARKCHSTVAKIDSALSSFDHKLLCDLAQVEDYKNLINEIAEEQDSDHDLPSSENMDFSAEGLVGIERDIQIKHASTLERYNKSWMKILYVTVSAKTVPIGTTIEIHFMA